MTPRLDVVVDEAAPESARIALATLPRSYRTVEGTGDVAVIGGTDGWSARAASALRAGARGILVIDPVPERPVRADLSALSAAQLVLSTPLAGHRAIAAAREPIAALLRSHAVIEVTIAAARGEDPRRALAGALGVLRALGVPARGLRLYDADAHGLDAICELAAGARAGVRAGLAAVFTDDAEHGAAIRLVDAAGSVTLGLPAPGAPARPATLAVDDESGRRTIALPFESAARSALVALHDLVVTGGPARGDGGTAGAVGLPGAAASATIADLLADDELVATSGLPAP